MEEEEEEEEEEVLEMKETKLFLCHIPGCQKAFSRSQNLNEHMNRHTGEKPVKCDQCEETFYTSDQKSKHKEQIHSLESYECSLCNKVFKRKRNLREHMQTHIRDKQFKCEECLEWFQRKSDLKKHVAAHSSHQPYTCHVCQQSFKWQNSLRRHEKTHSAAADRPHKCDQCGMAFIQKTDLSRHSKTHGGGSGGSKAAITCNICQAKFSRRDSLHRHYKTHKNAICCPISGCWQRFRSKQSLLWHFGSGHSRSEVDAVTTFSTSFIERLSEEGEDDPEPEPSFSRLTDCDSLIPDSCNDSSITDSLLLNGEDSSFGLSRASQVASLDQFLENQIGGVFVDNPPPQLNADQDDKELTDGRGLLEIDYAIDNEDAIFVIAE